MKTVFILTVFLFVTQSFAVDWAVLVSGSTAWVNYRHQADVCHARKLAYTNGIPNERIITLVFDDIANSGSNPFPGKIFNKPTSGDGEDVYAGCVQPGDYTGKDVSADHFIAVLLGDESKVPAGKKVLKSTSQDNVFINFVDHGAVGVIAFPDRLLPNSELMTALGEMKTRNLYNKLVFYLESCESGSMFNGLLQPNLNIYATTAAGPAENSWGTYCPPDDVINGKVMNTCLGDLFEVSWMENLESAGKNETLEEQYKITKQKTTLSAVTQYGDTSFTSLPVGNFIGDGTTNYGIHKKPAQKETSNTSVRSRDIPLHIAYYKYLRSDPIQFEERQALADELLDQITRRQYADKLFYDLSQIVVGEEKGLQLFHAAASSPAVCGECCTAVNNHFQQNCGGYDDYSLQYTRVVYNLCKATNDVQKIINGLLALCKN